MYKLRLDIDLRVVIEIGVLAHGVTVMADHAVALVRHVLLSGFDSAEHFATVVAPQTHLALADLLTCERFHFM